MPCFNLRDRGGGGILYQTEGVHSEGRGVEWGGGRSARILMKTYGSQRHCNIFSSHTQPVRCSLALHRRVLKQRKMLVGSWDEIAANRSPPPPTMLIKTVQAVPVRLIPVTDMLNSRHWAWLRVKSDNGSLLDATLSSTVAVRDTLSFSYRPSHEMSGGRIS